VEEAIEKGKKDRKGMDNDEKMPDSKNEGQSA